MNNANSSSTPRPFSLGLYLLIVFAFSWPFQIASALWATSLLSRYALISTAMVMVTVGSFIAGRYIFRDGFADVGWRWGNLKHYLAALGLVSLLWIIPTLIRILTGALDPSALDKTKFIWLLILPLATLIPGFGEEFGWRGYMLPHLARRLSARKAAFLHALIWWVWHLPVLIITGIQADVAGGVESNMPAAVSVLVTVVVVVVAGAIPSIMHGIVFAYLWTRSESIAVVTVYHAAYDGLRDSLAIVAGLPPMVGLWANALLTILGIAFLWKGNWQQLEEISKRN